MCFFLFYFAEINKDDNLTPEMPNFQSDEGRRLSTKKINPNKFDFSPNRFGNFGIEWYVYLKFKEIFQTVCIIGT